MRRFESLDIARGLAALEVVLHHSGIYSAINILPASVINYLGVGVQILFVISGYVIYQSIDKNINSIREGFVPFIKKRFLRIYPLFWVSIILAIIVDLFIYHQSYTGMDILTSATLTYSIFGFKSPQSVYWALVHIQQFYIVMAILILPIFNKTRVSLILLSSIIPVLVTLRLVSNWYVNTFLPAHWLEFELGILAYLLINQRVKRIIGLPVFILLVVIGLLGNYRTQSASIFACLILVLWRFDVFVSTHKVISPMKFFGKISYSLFLIHFPIMMVINYFFKGYFPTNSIILIILGIVAAIGISTLFYYGVEIPLSSKLEKIGMKEPSTASA